jgi:hypothetical protein
MPRPKTWKLKTAPDKYGRSVTKKVTTQVDVSAFTECAIFPYLVMAANPHLSAPDIQDVLASFGAHQWRSETWIKTRRWMCNPPEDAALQPSTDGLDGRARHIMKEHSRWSARKLVKLLLDNGIVRPIEWVYRSRFD